MPSINESFIKCLKQHFPILRDNHSYYVNIAFTVEGTGPVQKLYLRNYSQKQKIKKRMQEFLVEQWALSPEESKDIVKAFFQSKYYKDLP